MELLTQLNISDPDLEILISRDLKERHPQINSKTKIVLQRGAYVAISDFDAKRFIDDALKSYHSNLREDLKEEIRQNLGQIINDKNYLMKIADKYYQDKVDYYSTNVYNFEYVYCEFNGKCVVLDYVYLPENDTIYLKS